MHSSPVLSGVCCGIPAPAAILKSVSINPVAFCTGFGTTLLARYLSTKVHVVAKRPNTVYSTV
jgi:hypothetical protein